MRIFSKELVSEATRVCNVANLQTATIGEILLVAQYLEKKTGIPFIRMDQGSPGLPVNAYGVEAEKAALDRGVGSQRYRYNIACVYPNNRQCGCIVWFVHCMHTTYARQG